MAQLLSDALSAVDWNSRIIEFTASDNCVSTVHATVMKVAVLAGQVQAIDNGNPALPFIQEMQVAAHDIARCIALSLYKPSASAMRSMLECALYYAYFRAHPMELETLIRVEKYYISKKEILEFFQTHVDEWSSRQSSVALVSRLESWYSKISAIVHGQIPGHWHDGISVHETKHDQRMLEEVVQFAASCGDLVRDIFLCSFLSEKWSYVEADAKRILLKGVSAGFRQNLRLDLA
ncbi:hypothetical protein [Xanthomonas campestris]|uniref:hypothetical protein n=1 Tax=Xanthomonas campestris TaxID=339 RepID=UPI00128FD432|nr:hypothetical protein [Xanthomonas campestris]